MYLIQSIVNAKDKEVIHIHSSDIFPRLHDDFRDMFVYCLDAISMEICRRPCR
ncbi:hypothetical protein KL86DYS2_10466 [uncultured Dysgonomonas sp.]|uniref:Uncharacterized protein n=1 Tax=uncultured Dysgonomonas sp. TaxID=206096 RepID=A0A212J0R0_9BACT|nr:hypothetical protein KL86DYS2_10466 [uncultured Dysgonomonas sp.]